MACIELTYVWGSLESEYVVQFLEKDLKSWQPLRGKKTDVRCGIKSFYPTVSLSDCPLPQNLVQILSSKYTEPQQLQLRRELEMFAKSLNLQSIMDKYYRGGYWNILVRRDNFDVAEANDIQLVEKRPSPPTPIETPEALYSGANGSRAQLPSNSAKR